MAGRHPQAARREPVDDTLEHDGMKRFLTRLRLQKTSEFRRGRKRRLVCRHILGQLLAQQQEAEQPRNLCCFAGVQGHAR